MPGKYDDRFRSTFDPLYRGKVAREQQERRERDQHVFRGCGNPDCPMCNPDTAGRGISGGSWGAQSARSPAAGSLEAMAQAEFSRMIESGAVCGPPASFAKAREAVEQWLCPAPEQAFEDIVGNEAALEQLKDAIQAPVRHKALYEAYGMKMPKGALLSGPPGCGKTMFAKAAAAEMRRLYGEANEFISIAGSELQSMFIGQTEAYIKSIFTFAREYQAFRGHPLLVFMDEAEVLLPDRTGRVRRVASWEESQVATFLAEMDGMRENGAFLLLATNRPEVIDQAVLRDGRCDFKITVQRPTRAAAELILQKNFAGILTGADPVEQLVFAGIEALYDPSRVLVEAHIIAANLAEQKIEHRGKHFGLEHIVSGAMVASIPMRAKRRAFARDKADGVARGVLVADVLGAVGDIFQENKGLSHQFALEEFMADFRQEFAASQDAPSDKSLN